MQFTLIHLLLLVSLILLPLQVMAEETEPEPDPGEKVKILKNIGQLFRSFVNLDTTFNFMSDDIFIKNQCLRRDIMALHAMKTQISDNLISNYATITQNELAIQSDMYTAFTGELYYLRNLNLLRNPETNIFEPTPNRIQSLKQRVLEKMPDRHANAVTILFPDWVDRYEDKLEEYAFCRNSWTAVVEKVDSIVESAEEIVTQSKAFGESFMELGETIANTPELFYLNTRNNLEYSILGSYYETRDLFLEDIEAIREETEIFTNGREERLALTLAEQQRLLGVGQTLGQAFLGSDSSLQGLINAASSSFDANRARDEYLADLVTQSTLNYFHDNANLSFMQYLADSNIEIISINALLSTEDTGLDALVKKVESNQCSA